jgi:hypothetical protein
VEICCPGPPSLNRAALWPLALNNKCTTVFLSQEETDHRSGIRRVCEKCQVCCLPGHLCPPCSAGLAAGQQPPGSIHLGCPPPLIAKRQHEDHLQHYDCTDQPAAAQPARPSGAGGGAAASAAAYPLPQHAGSQDNGNGNLVLPQLKAPRRGIRAEAGSLPGVFQLSGPAAHSAQPNSVATPSHAAIEQALAPIQGLASALRRHVF